MNLLLYCRCHYWKLIEDIAPLSLVVDVNLVLRRVRLAFPYAVVRRERETVEKHEGQRPRLGSNPAATAAIVLGVLPP
jgi:hypothetical protein